MRGKLIVLEGLDRSGKSTQCGRLAANLRARGDGVMELKFPDRSTSIGKMIDAYLRRDGELEDHVIHLLFSANRWEAAAAIRSAIEAGESVVVDRYFYSGYVYSAAKDNPSLGLRWARQPEVGLPRPDVCVFLDISAENAAKRGGFGEEKYENRKMQDRVRTLFQEVLNSGDGEDIVWIDGGGEVEAVEKQVLDAVLEACRRVDRSSEQLRVVTDL